MSLTTPTRRSSAIVPCDAALIYDVLTDYENYTEWFPLVVHSKTLAREGDLAIAEFDLATPQKDQFDFECIHTRNKMVLWRTLGGRLPIAQAEWTIKGGATSRDSSEVTLAVTSRIHWGHFLPGARGFLNPKQCIKALQSQLATYLPESDAASLVLRNDDGERILELAETEDGIICWIRGKKYILHPEEQEGRDSPVRSAQSSAGRAATSASIPAGGSLE